MALAKAEECPTCGHELVVIAITVDNNELEMSSCQTCDTRSWNHAGQPVDLAFALGEVGTHAGRQR